jgi:glucosamine--fructose-6-phosphate aminotransferase (isomerizing)
MGETSMTQPGVHSYAEIMSQPDTLVEAERIFAAQIAEAEAIWRAADYDELIVTGCGSTYYVSLAAAATFQRLTGVAARAYPASQIALMPEQTLRPTARPMLLAISRSGSTTETVAAIRKFRAHKQGAVMAITCDSTSPLAKETDLAFNIDAAQETSVAQTRTFSSMLLVAQALSAHLAGHSTAEALSALPGNVRAALSQVEPLAKQLGEDQTIERFFFLGLGSYYGIACEAMLKMKEMSLSYSEAYHTLEFRHGPMSMVHDRSLVVGLLSDETLDQEIAVLRDMHMRGARTLAIAARPVDPAPAIGHIIQIDNRLPAWTRPNAAIPALQLLAYYRAIANGQNPDTPENLTFVISLNEAMM